MKTVKLLLPMILCMILASRASAASPEGLSFGLKGSYQQSFWQPQDKAEANGSKDTRIVEYKTEGLQSYRVDANLGYSGASLFTAHYEKPVKETSEQQEMMRVNDDSTTGLEKFVGGVQLDPIARMLGLDDYRLARFILSARYRYSQELFHGKAEAKSNFFYIPGHSQYEPITRYIYGIELVNYGDEISFKTKFVDHEYSVNIVELFLPDGNASRISPIEVRLGYFESTWDRPSASNTNWTYSNYPILYETRYHVKGHYLDYGSRDMTAPGLKWDIYFKKGRKVSISNQLDPEFVSSTDLLDDELKYEQGGITLLYNWYFWNDRLGLTLGGSMDERRFYQNRYISIQAEKPAYTTVQDDERLYSVFGGIALRLP